MKLADLNLGGWYTCVNECACTCACFNRPLPCTFIKAQVGITEGEGPANGECCANNEFTMTHAWVAGWTCPFEREEALAA